VADFGLFTLQLDDAVSRMLECDGSSKSSSMASSKGNSLDTSRHGESGASPAQQVAPDHEAIGAAVAAVAAAGHALPPKSVLPRPLPPPEGPKPVRRASVWMRLNQSQGVGHIEPTGKTGSCRYMAPEVWMGKSYTNKVDVFSFAILSYEMMVGTRAYSGTRLTMEQAASGCATRGLRPKLPSNFSPTLSDLLTSCWQDVPESRPHFSSIVVDLVEIQRAALKADKEGSTNDVLDSLKLGRSAEGGCCTIS